ncbi:MAG: hypothetical protein IPP17_26675 [Bacteroidetes bacterium]|nr:hypothetical protein [Bacteroidota bacterium]
MPPPLAMAIPVWEMALEMPEDVAGDQWVSTLNVTADQSIMCHINLMVGFPGQQWLCLDSTGTASLNCSILLSNCLILQELRKRYGGFELSAAGEFGLKNYVLSVNRREGLIDFKRLRSCQRQPKHLPPMPARCPSAPTNACA